MGMRLFYVTLFFGFGGGRLVRLHRTKVPGGWYDLRADWGGSRYSRDSFDDGSEDVAMHDWMIGLGFIVLLITPCLIAMWRGVESVDES
jgi:hypothetical protein